MDSAEILRPDPGSTHFINETERFNKDFNVNDQGKRAVTYEKNQEKIVKLRKERLDREEVRFNNMEKTLKYQDDLIDIKRDNFNLGKKNMGGASFNIVTLGYDESEYGQRLQAIDNDAKVRSMIRSKVLD